MVMVAHWSILTELHHFNTVAVLSDIYLKKQKDRSIEYAHFVYSLSNLGVCNKLEVAMYVFHEFQEFQEMAGLGNKGTNITNYY